jgi:CheY-specific phosphatase CheX
LAGFITNISPPTLLYGKGAVISTLDYPRLVVPLIGSNVSLVIHLALREGRNQSVNLSQTPVVKMTTF